MPDKYAAEWEVVLYCNDSVMHNEVFAFLRDRISVFFGGGYCYVEKWLLLSNRKDYSHNEEKTFAESIQIHFRNTKICHVKQQ